MAVKIEFEASTVAFAAGGYEEVLRVLRQLVDTVDSYNRGTIRDISGTIRDIYGDQIGGWSATIDAVESADDA